MSIKKRAGIRIAQVNRDMCVACGTCENVCPRGAIKIVGGVYAKVQEDKCVGCLKCIKECPASIIEIILKEGVV